MKKKISPTDARRIMARVPTQTSFWLCTNNELRSLKELVKTLSKITDDVFRYHVNKDKNDFEAWIRDVINDKELAREISRVKTKETLLRKIQERTDELSNIIAKSKKKKPVKKKAVKKKKRRR